MGEFTPNDNTRIVLGFKGASPDDSIKLGNRAKAQSKFIQQINKAKGIPQLVRDASHSAISAFFGINFWKMLIMHSFSSAVRL